MRGLDCSASSSSRKREPPVKKAAGGHQSQMRAYMSDNNRRLSLLPRTPCMHHSQPPAHFRRVQTTSGSWAPAQPFKMVGALQHTVGSSATCRGQSAAWRRMHGTCAVTAEICLDRDVPCCSWRSHIITVESGIAVVEILGSAIVPVCCRADQFGGRGILAQKPRNASNLLLAVWKGTFVPAPAILFIWPRPTQA